jgi:hypothetical protein
MIAPSWPRPKGPSLETPSDDPSRQKLGVELLIEDATLRAIGHVLAQWAVLEIEFDVLLEQLLRHPNTKEIVPDRIPQSFGLRAELLRQCAERLLGDQPRLRENLISIINDALSARGHRDKVIHGQWHLGRKKGKLGTAVTVINLRPKFRAQIENMSDQQIEGVAAVISDVSARLMWWRAVNMKSGDAS